MFVANPHKTKPILDILVKNKEKVRFCDVLQIDLLRMIILFDTWSVSSGMYPDFSSFSLVDSKLVEFLDAFHKDRAEDEQFSEEKTYLIKQIKEL